MQSRYRWGFIGVFASPAPVTTELMIRSRMEPTTLSTVSSAVDTDGPDVVDSAKIMQTKSVQPSIFSKTKQNKI